MTFIYYKKTNGLFLKLALSISGFKYCQQKERNIFFVMQLTIGCVPPAAPDTQASLRAAGATRRRHRGSW